MKKAKIKSIFFLKFFFLLVFSIGVVYGSSQIDFSTQTAIGLGSNNSSISVSYPSGDTRGITSYINKGENSSIIGNYFTGYYYDSIFGFFKLDRSTDHTKNVRIIDSTDKCGSGYGYKLGGYAYSESMGYIDFDYSNEIYVYHCESDDKLHGYAYSKHVGFQSFEGIGFQVISIGDEPIEPETSPGVFVNEDSRITSTSDSTPSGESAGGSAGGSLPPSFSSIDDTQESIFYIIK